MSISIDYPMPAPSLSPHATHWGRGLLLALAAHLLIVIWAYWPSHSQPETPLPPAAVMMLLAPQVQAPSIPLPLPQGVQQQMAASASSAKAEIVGEKHDNLQHHQIEQWLMQQLPSQRPQGSVLMEMLTPSQQAKVDSSKLWLQQNPQAQPEQVAQRLEWQKGWPWAQYQGVVMAAMHGAYPLWSANLDRAEIMAFYQHPVLPAGKASQQPQALQAISDTIRTSHGGEIAPAQLKAMLAIQQQRDHRMAQRLLAAPTPALLIVGAFHALKDTSVPLHMADLDNGKLPTVLILAEAGTTVSASQADYVWYTGGSEPVAK